MRTCPLVTRPERDLVIRPGFARIAKRNKNTKAASIHKLPNEILEKVLTQTDSYSLTVLRLVCTHLLTLIDKSADGFLRPSLAKNDYTTIVFDGRARSVTLQKWWDDRYYPTPTSPSSSLRRCLLRSHVEREGKDFPRQRRPSLGRRRVDRSGCKLQLTDMIPRNEEHLLNHYIRHLSCRSLVFYNLQCAGLENMLSLTSIYCATNTAVHFINCDFTKVNKQLLIQFLRSRRGSLEELFLRYVHFA
jgi:hypothetical protein